MRTTNLCRNLKRLSATFLVCLPIIASTQVNQEIDATSVTKINILNPGVSHEQRIGKNQTIYSSVMMNILLQTVVSSTFSETNVFLDPAALLGYRYYFNFAKRAEREKRYEKNSGNYVSAYSGLVYTKAPLDSDHYDEINRRAVGVIAACWGMQRNYRGHFSLDLSLGLQYQFGKATFFDFNNSMQKRVTTGRLLPAANLTLGIWLN